MGKKKRHTQTKKHAQTKAVISTISRGVGFVPHPDFDDDIQIAKVNLNTALNGDVVHARVLPDKKKGRVQGEVLKVISRARNKFVGTVSKENEVFLFTPDDKRIYTNFFISHPSKQLQRGDKVIALWQGWEDLEKLPRVSVKEVLGKAGEHEVEMKAILFDKGIDAAFPAEVEQEATRIKSASKGDFDDEDKSGMRRDMRTVTTFTIDPDTAKDFDDAISIRRIEKRIENKDKKIDEKTLWEIGIHIADVSHYVKPQTSIDREARARGFSTYLVDRTVPMLPEVLSNDLCSLNPHEDKLAFSAVFTVDKDGGIKDRWFGKTIIYSDKRFTYEEAQKTINGGGEYADELRILNDIAKTLRGKRFENGAIYFADDEIKFNLDAEGNILSIEKKIRRDTHKLVEEYMLLANKEVAKKIDSLSDDSGRDHFFLYRVHDVPDRERLEELGIFLRALGYEFHIDKEIDPKDINALLEAVRGKSEEGIVSTSILRSMAKAVYSTQSKGHFGLAFEYYTHFTSPIRRYSDLIVHRLLSRHLEGGRILNQEVSMYQKAASDLSEIERSVMEAERESIKYKQVEYMQDHKGETFDAIITGVAEHGLYVEEEATKASGLVHINTLGDDYFELDRKNYAIVGSNSKTKYSIGDEVRVKLVDTDLDRREIDFKLVR